MTNASPQKVVNRAPEPVVQRASNPVATTAGKGSGLNSPYTARFAGSIVQRQTNPNGMSSDGGDRMFRSSDGKLLELPPGLSFEQATGLEADAKVAQKKLGKGPPPQPVPDVKKLAQKEVKKDRAKPQAKAKRLDRGRGQAAPKAAGAAGGLLKAVGKSKVAQFLAARGAPALTKGIGQLQKLRQNEQTHDDAAEKLTQSEKAVVNPPSEGQSKSNTGQVGTVGDRPAPPVDQRAAQGKLQETLDVNTPRTIEDVDNFKSDMKAQHMGADVMQVVQGDKNAVTSTFGEMEQTPPPAPPEQSPEALPPEEIAPSTPAMNLGQDTIAPLQKEHTDVTSFTKEADGKLQEEGVTQEQLDMVDKGDLAEANKEKKGLEKSVRTEPLAVQAFARQESQTVDRELKQEEKKDRDGVKAKRKAGLSATAQKQKGAKSALEKKRDEVAAKINGIYLAAQTSVKKKLADLETQSMKRFDDGNAKATRAFENGVHRELAAYKAERYSGTWGGYYRAKDWLLGMDELPEVQAIFDRNRAEFVGTIGRLVDDITADNKRVIQECKDELANARKAIQVFVDQLDPGLKDIGQKAAGEMNAKLDEMDQFVAKKELELQEKLKDKQAAAIKAIDQKIEKMKEAMSGALSKFGKLLLQAAKKFFTWALEKLGYSLATIEGVINKGAAVLKSIFTQPIQFVKNLMKAAMAGFESFGKNFLKHLTDALFQWLTGSLEGLVLPKTWDFPGIIGVALQMIGISYANIRKHMVTVMTEPVVAGLETTFKLVQTLVTEGPMAAWEQLKEMAGEMRDAFIDAVKDFIKMKIVEQAILWVGALLIPGAGIVKAIIGIYDTIVFFIQKAKQIMQMIANFLGSIGEIAAGNIGAAAAALESGLARGLSLVISFLAQLLRLGGITSKIRDAIQKIRGKVDAVLLKVAKWIATQAKKLLSKGLGGNPNAPAAERVTNGLEEGVAAVNKYAGRPVGAVVLRPKLAVIKARHRLSSLEVVPKGRFWAVSAAASPAKQKVIQAESAEETPKRTPSTVRQTRKLGGDTVGIKMTADWLGGSNSLDGGTIPASGAQDQLMELLVTAPKNSSEDKFIRGHLLNHHLGGRGNAENMFPITGNANRQHLDSTERDVKKWATIPDRWVKYVVEVQSIKSILTFGPKSPRNKVDCIFATTVELKDKDGKVEKSFSANMTSPTEHRL